MEFLQKLFRKKTITHALITFSGTAINGALGIIFFILLARFLGPEDFGLVSITILSLTLIADIADVGINTGIINFVSKYISEDKSRAYKYLKLGFQYKLLSWFVIIILGFLLSDFISQTIFNKPELSEYLKLSLFGVGGALLFSFVTNSLLALQKYWTWSFINIFSNGLRLVILIVLITLGFLNVYNSLIIYILLPFFGFFIGALFLPLSFLKAKNEQSKFSDFFSYNKWIALSIIVSAIYSRVDSFISASFLSIQQVGYYSVAVQLNSVIPQFVYALAVVIAPKIASYSSHAKVFKYIKKIQLLTLGIAAIGLMAIPLSFYLIPLIYTNSYNQSVFPFVILLISQLIFLISIPAHQSIFYYFSNPKIFVIFSLIQCIIVFSSAIILIPMYGILGAAFSVLLGSIFNFVITNTWMLKQFKKI